MAFGGIGAFAAGAPTAQFLASGGAWRDLFLCGAIWCFCGGVRRVARQIRQSDGTAWGFFYPDWLGCSPTAFFWRVAPLTVAVLGSAFAIQGLWAGPWLTQVAHQDANGVGVHLSVMAVALICGAVACGPILTLTRRHGFGDDCRLSAVVVTAGWQVWCCNSLARVCCCLGSSGSSSTPFRCHTVRSQRDLTAPWPRALTTAINALVLVGSFLLQWIIGAIVGLWSPVAPGVYPAVAYQAGFGFVLVCLMVSWLWFVASLARSAHTPGPI